MKIRNWKKISDNCWELDLAAARKKTYHKGTKKPRWISRTMCFRKGYSGDWVLANEIRILRRAKTKAKIYKMAIAYMRKHPHG